MRLAFVIVSVTSILWLEAGASLAQTIQWMHGFGPGMSVGGTGDGDRAYSTAVDSAGNIYVSGYFSGTVHLPSVSTSTTRTLMSAAGSADGFLAKCTPDGNCAWARRFGSEGWDGSYSVTVDVSDRICLTGWYTGAVDFNSGSLPTRGVTLTARDVAAEACDIFVATYDGRDGACLWARGMEGTSEVVKDAAGNILWGGSDGVDIAADRALNIYVTGFYTGTITIPGTTERVSSTGKEDIFIAKYNGNGDRQWIKGFGGTGGGGQETDHGRSITVDGNGNVYVAGSFRGAADFGGGARAAAGPAPGDPPAADAFIAKFDSAGTHRWSKAIGGTADDSCEQLVSSPSTGMVYATGWFKGTADFAPMEQTPRNLTARGYLYDVFVAAYCTQDPSGSNHWAISIGDEGPDEGYGVGTDGQGNVYVAGGFGGTVDFDPAPNIDHLLTATAPVSPSADPWDPTRQDAFLASYCSGGHFRWAMRLGGDRADFGRAITVSPDGRQVHFAGYFANRPTLTVPPPGDGRSFNGTGDSDAFLMRVIAPSRP